MKTVTEQMASEAVARLSSMAFFPELPAARLQLAEMVFELVDTEDHLKRWVEMVLATFGRWPGWADLLRLYLQNFPPKGHQESEEWQRAHDAEVEDAKRWLREVAEAEAEEAAAKARGDHSRAALAKARQYALLDQELERQAQQRLHGRDRTARWA